MNSNTGTKPIEENENIITEENQNNEIKKEKNSIPTPIAIAPATSPEFIPSYGFVCNKVIIILIF